MLLLIIRPHQRLFGLSNQCLFNGALSLKETADEYFVARRISKYFKATRCANFLLLLLQIDFKFFTIQTLHLVSVSVLVQGTDTSANPKKSLKW